MYFKRFFIPLNGNFSLEYCYTLGEMFKTEERDYYIDETPDLSRFAELWQNYSADYWGGDGVGAQLWAQIWAKNRDHIAFITTKPWNNADIEASKPFWVDFYKIWKSTYGYYETLIKLMSQNQDKLLAQLSSETESENQFNDLPDQSGDYANINYATNLTKTKITTLTDAGTVLDRLEEVRRRYNDYYEKWAREFDKLFISPLNYDKQINEEDDSE